MHSEVRSALTGHSAKMDESAMYGDEMKTFVHLLAENIAKVKAPVAPRGRPEMTTEGPCRSRQTHPPGNPRPRPLQGHPTPPLEASTVGAVTQRV
jgi:hypothetical protein